MNSTRKIYFLIAALLSANCFLSFSKLNAQAEMGMLSQKQMQYELGVIRDSWQVVHPGLYRYNTPETVDGWFSLLARQLDKPTPLDQYHILLAQLACKVRCGHTYLNPWNQKDAVKEQLYAKHFLPFLFKVIDKKIIITHDLTAERLLLPGTEVLAINGVTTSRILDSLLTVSRTDGQNGLAKQFDNITVSPLDIDTNNYALFDIFFPAFFPTASPNEYQLDLLPFGGSITQLTVPAYNKKERQLAYEQRYYKIAKHEDNWTIQLLEKETALLRIGDFETWEWKTEDGYKSFLDSAFNVIASWKARHLILDVRDNEGGADDARDELLAYLLKQPYVDQNKSERLIRYMSLPDSLLPYLKTWDAAFKTAKDPTLYRQTEDGYYRRLDDSVQGIVITPKSNHFTGQVFALIGPRNSSTTFTLASILQETHAATLVGEPTGGTKQGINGGQFFFLRLPYSNIEMDIPITFRRPIEPSVDEGVKPDYIVSSSQASIAQDKDTVLAFVLEYLIKK